MAKNKSTPPEEGQVKGRVLTACHLGKTNDVVTLSAVEAAQAVAQGVLDTNEAAVAYAELLDTPAAP